MEVYDVLAGCLHDTAIMHSGAIFFSNANIYSQEDSLPPLLSNTPLFHVFYTKKHHAHLVP